MLANGQASTKPLKSPTLTSKAKAVLQTVKCAKLFTSFKRDESTVSYIRSFRTVCQVEKSSVSHKHPPDKLSTAALSAESSNPVVN